MRIPIMLAAAAIPALAACDLDSELAPRVELEVVVDGTQITSEVNDLGYTVEPTRCRVVIADVLFTTEGEMHASLGGRLWDLVVPTAHAHPGHTAGGEVVGELPGRFVFDWRDDGASLGLATLLQTHYDGANFRFARGQVEDGLLPDDPLVGHPLELRGTATRDGQSWTFEALVDQDEDREVVGAPLDLEVDGSTDARLGLTLSIVDPVEGDTVFDGIDFFTLDDDGDGHVVLLPGSEAYNLLRRNLQSHDNYRVAPR